MKNKIKFLLIISLFTKAFAVGEAGAVFLLINPGSSAAGAGEAQVAKVDDAYASYYNPAGLGFLRGRDCLLYTSPSPRDKRQSRMPSSA